jgi:hypothetical protein
VAYGRRLEANTLLVVLNSTRHAVTLDVPVDGYLDEGTSVRDVWGDRVSSVTGTQLEGIQVPARAGIVLEVLA